MVQLLMGTLTASLSSEAVKHGGGEAFLSAHESSLRPSEEIGNKKSEQRIDASGIGNVDCARQLASLGNPQVIGWPWWNAVGRFIFCVYMESPFVA